MTAYYNEIDAFAAEWLRNLISSGHIAPGDVDTRSIEDVLPSDLAGYTQCHFFAGIGVWSYALRLAGWPDDKPVWTGSCPCQPFSAAGKGHGVADERHLWPAWFHLIEQCRPAVVFGEQVEAAIKHGWLDLVQDDMEGIGYTCWPVGLPAAGVGAPHIRQRLWFVADTYGVERRQVCPVSKRRSARGQQEGMEQRPLHCGDGGMEHTNCLGWIWRETSAPGDNNVGETPERPEGVHGSGIASAYWLHQHGTSKVNGQWRDADWLRCRDGLWRPVEPGAFPLVDRAPQRMGRLRAYGNAIVPQVAEAVIRAYLES